MSPQEKAKTLKRIALEMEANAADDKAEGLLDTSELDEYQDELNEIDLLLASE